MGKITKLMLTAALIIAGVGGVKAGKLYADLSKLSNGPESTWDGSTNTMTWTATSNNMISNFDFAAGNYSAYESISITVSDITNAVGIRLQIKANGQEKLVALNGNGTYTKKLIDDFGFTAADLASVEWVRVLGSAWQNGETNTIDADHPASAVISDVYLYQPMKTLEVNLSDMAASEGNATWDSSTGTFAWTGTWSNAITLPGLSGNLSAYTTVNYETSAGSCDHFRILIYYSNSAAQTTYYASVGNKSVTFEDMGVVAANLASVASIKISGASDATGDITLTSFSLEGPLVNYIEATTTYAAPAGTTDLKDLQTSWAISYPKDIASETSWGGNIDSNDGAATITDYDYLHFVVTSATSDAHTGLRVFVWDGSQRVCLYPHPIADYAGVTDWTATSWITAPGTYVVKISGYPLFRGIKALQSWADNAGTITVSQAYLSSGAPVAYIPSGKYTLVGEATGSASLTSALADASATCYDATGVTGTGVDLTGAANPNALFIANAGVLANTNNVIVNNTCANLVLTDGYAFKAPADFTATEASYTTTINTEAKAGTLCLPFAATIPSGVDAYTLTYTGGDAATAEAVENTIPANTPVLLNGEGEVTFSGSGAAVSASATNTEGAMTGVFEATIVPEDSYVLQKQDDKIGFFKVNSSDITAAPFRAYVTAQNAGSRLNIVYAGEATGISTTLNNNEGMMNVYDLQGRRVVEANSTLSRGLYIVNGKKIMVK